MGAACGGCTPGTALRAAEQAAAKGQLSSSRGSSCTAGPCPPTPIPRGASRTCADANSSSASCTSAKASAAPAPPPPACTSSTSTDSTTASSAAAMSIRAMLPRKPDLEAGQRTPLATPSQLPACLLLQWSCWSCFAGRYSCSRCASVTSLTVCTRVLPRASARRAASWCLHATASVLLTTSKKKAWRGGRTGSLAQHQSRATLQWSRPCAAE